MSNTCGVCGKSAEKRCSVCQGVYYCSQAHQKEDWKEHKKTCRQYIIMTNEKYGRYIVAARDITPGTILMTESAIMIGPKQNTLPVCLGCHKSLKRSGRGSGSGIHYCSKCSFPMCGATCEKVSVVSNI